MNGAKPYSNVEIEIARDSAHPEALDDAINKVFSIGIDEQLGTSAATTGSHSSSICTRGKKGPEPASNRRIYHPAVGHQPYSALRHRTRHFPLLQKAWRSRGCVIGLVVDENGLPPASPRSGRWMGGTSAPCRCAAIRFSPAIYTGIRYQRRFNIEGISGEVVC